MEKQLTVGSLFAGIGGFDLGFRRAGYKIKWQVEIDPFCRKVLAKHFPEAERFEDVRTVGKSNLVPVNVLCGGFPCQDISVAGKGAGIKEGTRSGLWIEFARIIGELRPQYVVVENVRALFRRGIQRVLGDLADLGYDAEWRIISAKQVGLNHLRERVWIVAYPMQVGRQVSQRSNETPHYQVGHRASDNFGWQGNEFCKHVPDSEILLTDDWKERTQRVFTEEIPRFETFSWCQDVRRVEDLRGRPDIPEPLFRGSRDGVPNWVGRVGACGNAVVPQIPEWIANQILKYEILEYEGLYK